MIDDGKLEKIQKLKIRTEKRERELFSGKDCSTITR